MTTVRELLTTWSTRVDDGPLKKLGASINAVKSAALVAGGVVAGAAASLFGLAEAARRTIDDFDELAQAAGVNTGWFVEFSTAARLGGSSTESAANAMGKFSKTIADARDGNKEAIKSFEALGISQEDVNNLPTEALVARVADEMKKLGVGAKASQGAMDLFGKSGRELLPTLFLGADGMEKVGAKARLLAYLVERNAGPANEMEGALAGVALQAEILKVSIGAKLMPIITDIANKIAAWAEQNQGLIFSKVNEWIATLSKVVSAAWDAFVKLFETTKQLVETTRQYVEQAKALAEAFSKNDTAIRLAKDALALFLGLMVGTKLFAFTAALQAATAQAGLFGTVSALVSTAMKGIITQTKLMTIALASNPIGLLLVALSVLAAVVIANWDDIVEVVSFAWDKISTATTKAIADFKAAWGQVADWFEQTVTKPIKNAFDFTGVGGQLADMLGIDGGAAKGHSPGRPGSADSFLSAPPHVGPFGRGGGDRSVSIQAPITIHAAAGMSSTERDDLVSRVRTTVREVFAQEARGVLASMP